ncbi:MBG domain-containing protein [Roseivirga seohaensis]|uniref:MBG domain-containing protein n=1 Tax=Roseivirga seohaensis TaxID=1914963 RepID=UPI003BAB7739
MLTKVIEPLLKRSVSLVALFLIFFLQSTGFAQIKFTIYGESASATTLTVVGSGSATTNGKAASWTTSNGYNQIFGNASFNYTNSSINFITFNLSGDLTLSDGVTPIVFSAIVIDDDTGSDYDDIAFDVSSIKSMAANTSYSLSGSSTFTLSGATFGDLTTGTYAGTFDGLQGGFDNFSTSDIVVEIIEGSPSALPVASNVTFSGRMSIGEELTGAYTYSHDDDNQESGTVFKWYRSDNVSGTNKAAISGATALTYTLTEDDVDKYISFEVTPSDGTDVGSAVESTLQGPVLGPFVVASIERQDPSNETVSAQSVTFRVSFVDNATNVTTDDFSLNSTVDGEIASVTKVDAKTYDVVVNNLTNTDGSLSLQIKGVDGASGSNDIKRTVIDIGAKTITQTNTNDYLDQAKLGQTFTATTDNYLTAYTIYPKSGNYSFSGTADLNVYSGNELAGGASLIESQTISLTSSTDAGGQTFMLENPVQLTQGEVYSIVMNNFTGSGSHALESSTSGNYAGGRVIFTGTSTSSHTDFDLKIDIYEGTVTVGDALRATAPQTSESYTLEAINAAPTASNVTFSGTLEVNEVLTGAYDYADAENDAQSGTTFQWYRSDDASGTNKTAINGATANTYTLTLAEATKYISFEVTPNDGNNAGTSVESTLQGPLPSYPPGILNITRQAPSTETTGSTTVVFRVKFSDQVTNVDVTDFVLNSTVNGAITSVELVSDNSTYYVTVSGLDNAVGTVSLGIKGVDGESGSNDIATFTANENLETDYNGSGDYLNQASIGQTFIAATSDRLSKITIFPKSGNHTFSGTATLAIYDGDQTAGGTLILSQTVNITNSTDAGGQSFAIPALPQLTQGNTYSFLFSSFSGSGSHALVASNNAGFANGHVIFTGMNSTSHLTDLDLAFQVYESVVTTVEDLSNTAPVTSESYTKEEYVRPPFGEWPASFVLEGGSGAFNGANHNGLNVAIPDGSDARLPGFAPGDLDGDGDIDFLVGSFTGRVYPMRNVGTSTAPNWEFETGWIPTIDSLDTKPGTSNEGARPVLVDIDNDGDLDLFIGNQTGWDANKATQLGVSAAAMNDVVFFRNIGDIGNPVFEFQQIEGLFADPDNGTEWFHTNYGSFASPSFADLDGDDDLDLIVMGNDTISYAENIGTKEVPQFSRKYRENSPFEDFSPVANRSGSTLSEPNFVDVDNDGDLDLFSGRTGGGYQVILNSGTTNSPEFLSTGRNNDLIPDVLKNFSTGQHSLGRLADLNGDGVLDFIVANLDGDMGWFSGVSNRPSMISAVKTDNNTITITYSENVQTKGTNPTDFVVTDCRGNTFEVTAQVDGTAGDTDIVLTVASLEFAVGDLTITYTNNNDEISDLNDWVQNTDDTGVVISASADAVAPTLASATKDSDTEITITFSENVDVLEANPTDFTVKDGVGNTYVVSAIDNGTVGDDEVTLTVADLSDALGDIIITYANNNNEVVDFACNALTTDATGVTIDLDNTAPTLVSATKDSDSQITLTFSEKVQIDGADASNFTVEDANSNGFCILSLTDGTAEDNQLILGFDNLSSAVGKITITYDPSSGNISDFGGNNLAADATGVEILLDVTAPSGYSVSLDDDLINATEATNATFTFAGAEVGATYNYTVSSENGGTNVTGSGTVATATDQITLADLSGLNDGELTLSVKLTDPASNEGIAVTDNTNMDATAPTAPTVGAVGDDNGPSNSDFITNDQSLIIGGLAEANSSVEVFIDNTSVGTTTTNGQGTYLLDYTGTDLSEGEYSITAKATDAAGNTSSASTAQEVVIDLTAPTVTITSDANDPQSGAFKATFTFLEDVSGFAEEDISVSNGVASNFNTTSAKIYTATITPSADGNVTVNVAADKAQDAGGNGNTVASELRVVNDETAPAAPIVASISTDAGSSATDNLTNDQTLEISGTSEANASLEVFIGGNSIGNTTADGSGNWTYDHTGSSLPEASHSITAKATDAAGNESATSTALDITVDISAPSLSSGTIAGKTYGLTENVDVTYVFSEIVLVDETNGTPSVTIAMGGQQRVAAYHSGSGTNTLVFRYTTVAGDIDGNGVSVSAINTNGGTIQDAAGNDASTSISVSGAADVRVDTSAPYMSITSSSNTVSGAFTAIFTFNEDVSGFDVSDISVGNGSAGSFNTASAKIYTATITPSADGSVTVNVAADKAQDAGGNGNTAASELRVVNDETAPAAPIVASISTDTGSSGTDNLTNDQTLEINGTAEANASVEVFVGGNSIGNTTADGSGNWTYDHTGSSLTEATHSITAKATDAAGNESIESTALSVTVDITAPSAPVITGISNDTGVSDSDGLTNDDEIEIHGTAEANSTVEVFIDNNSVGTIDADASGNWTLDRSRSALAENTYSITSKATDLAGNESSASAAFSLQIDLTGPALAPSVGAVGNDNGPSNSDFITNDQTLIIGGNATANSRVEVYIDGTSTAIATTNAQGTWLFNHEGTTLPAGTYSITAKELDNAGNYSPVSAAKTLVIELTQPTVTITNNANDPQRGSFTATFTFSEDVSGFDVNDISVTNGTAGSFSATSASVYTAKITPSADGQVTVGIAANKATDIAGNFNTVAASINVTNDETAPSLVSATKDSDTQITLTFSEVVAPGANGHTGITVYGGNGKSENAVSASDGTVGDNKIVLTFNSLSALLGDFEVLHSGGSTITDLAGNVYPLDGTGAIIDLDQTAPTLVSATKDSETQITLTFSEPIKTLGINPTDFTVVDDNSTNFAVQSITDGTVEDNKLVLTVADMSTAQLNLNITYANNNNVVTDFGGNNLGSDATGVNIPLNVVPTATSVDFSGTLTVGETLTGAYTYSDADNDTESGTTFKWYRSDDANGTNKAAIAGATASTYDLTSADVDKYISFEVTPNDGKNFGVAVESNLQGPVSKISQTIAFNALEAKTYGDASFALSATASSNLGVTYTSSNTSVATVSGNTVSIVGAGQTTITASQAGDASYTAATNATQLLTVNKAVLTATAEDKSKIYGEANPSFTITYSGFVNGDDKTVITTEPTASTIADASTGVGTYDIDLAGGTAGNYSFNLTSGTLTIGKATLTAAADDKSKTYGEVNPALTISYAGFLNGDDESAITTEPTVSTVANASSVVGTYDIDLAGGVADNYNFSLNSGVLTIGKATITATVEDKSKTYGDDNPAFTIAYTGFVNGDDESAITTEPIASTAADATTGVGGYDIDLAGGAADNYNFSLNSGTLTIGKATLTATAEDKSKTYGEDNPNFTISYMGFVNGDDKTAITMEPTASTVADATTRVGTYDIDLTGGVADNYSFSLTSGTLTIGKATLTANAEDKNKVYGEANPALTISYSGFVNGDEESDITAPNASTTADGTSDAGTYDIALSGGSADNYSLVTVNGSLIIGKATLTATAENKQRAFGQANPEFTISYTGFVNGDDKSVIDTEPTASTTADESAVAGTAAITLSGGRDNNYDFNLVDGTLIIVEASYIISVSVPDDGTYAIGDEMSFIVNFALPVTIAGSPSLPLTVGSSTVTASLKGSVNDATSAIFSYIVEEGDLDEDGIELGTSIELNGGTIVDGFGTDAILALNNVASTAGVLVDGVAPTVTLTTAVGTLTNTKFELNISFDEVVTGFALSDIQVTNGTASNLVEVVVGKQWKVEITPGKDGTVTVGLPANKVTDTPGNANKAGNTISSTFDGTAPRVTSITRKTANPLLTAIASFRAIFSEDVRGVDLTDFEVILTGTATGRLSTITQVNAKTYDVNIEGISGEGTIGLNIKNDQSILDAAYNPLEGAHTGEVYVTNLSPTDITISSFNIAENNQVSAVIGSFTTIDADQLDGHTYSLVTGTGSVDNDHFFIDGSTLKAASVFDYETKSSYSIRVKTDDGKGGTFEKVFKITVTNVAEPKLRVTSNIDIPVTALGLTSNFDITIHNEGEAALTVNSVLFPEGFIGAVTGIMVNPGESRTIAFGFKPAEVKVYSGTIEFITNAGKVSVAVSGEGAIITGLDDGAINPETIRIFPNPASRILTIDLSDLGGEKLDIDIADASGAPLFSRKSFTEKTLQLDVSGYASGIYIIQITDGKSVVRKKVMIKK